jgi:hypothetical protein
LTALLTLVSSVQCCLSFPTGEISDALKDVWGDHVPRSDVVTGAYASQYGSAEDEAEFQDTVQEVEAFFQKEGRRPRMLVCKMGQDGHDRGGKVIASGFADLGFDVSRCLMCDVPMFRCSDVRFNVLSPFSLSGLRTICDPINSRRLVFFYHQQLPVVARLNLLYTKRKVLTTS